MTQPPEEPLKDVTLDDVLAGKVLDRLRRYFEDAQDPDCAANLKETHRSKLRELVDPRIEPVTPADPLLAVAERFVGQNPEKDGDLVAAVRAALGVDDDFPRFRTAAEALNDPEPVPLLQRRGGGGAILSVGEIAVLSGEGGSGKSTLAAQKAVTAARTGEDSYGSAAGLSIRGGPVAMLTYEDRAKRVADRLNAVELHLHRRQEDPSAISDPLHRIHLVDLAGFPLFGVPPGGHWKDHPMPLTVWSAVWEYLANLKPRPRLVVIDPVGEAFAANSNELAGVRAFYGALRKMAEALECGILLVAHSTKEDRKKDKATPGSVAGSAAWTDAARGVLTLDNEGPDPENPQPNDPFKLRLVKANYAKRFALRLKAWTKSDGEPIGFFEPEEDVNRPMTAADL